MSNLTVNVDNTRKNPQGHFYAVVQPSVIIYILYRKPLYNRDTIYKHSKIHADWLKISC